MAQSAYRRADPEKGSVFLVLENGVRYEGAPGDSVYRVINFERYTLRDRKMASAPVRYPLHGWETTRLWRSMGPYEQKEIAWRISKVIVLPTLMIFALSLGRVEPRSNRYVSMFSALLIYFTYTNLVTMVCARVPAGGFSAWIMLGCMHFIFASAAVYLLWCRTRGRPVISLQRVKTASA